MVERHDELLLLNLGWAIIKRNRPVSSVFEATISGCTNYYLKPFYLQENYELGLHQVLAAQT